MSFRKLTGLSAILVTAFVSAGVDGCNSVTDLDAPVGAISTGTDGFDQRFVGLWVGGRSFGERETRLRTAAKRKGRGKMSRIFLLMLPVFFAFEKNLRGDGKISRTSMLEKATRVAEQMQDLPSRINALAQLATLYRDIDPKQAQALSRTINATIEGANKPEVTDALLLAFIDGQCKVMNVNDIDALLKRFSDDSARDKAFSVLARNLSRHGQYAAAFENARKIKSHDKLFSAMSEIALRSAEGGDDSIAAAASREMNPESSNDLFRKHITVSQLAKAYQKAGKTQRARDTVRELLAFTENIDIAPQVAITVKLCDGGLNGEHFHERLAEVVGIIESKQQRSIRIDCLMVTVDELLDFDRIEESLQMLERAETPLLRDYLAGLIAERQAMKGDATAARETLRGISTALIKAPALLAFAKAAMTEARPHEARQILAEVRDLLDTQQSLDGLTDVHQLVLDVATLQVSIGDITQAISWVEGMEQPELKFECLLAIADGMSKRPKDHSP